VKSLAFDKACRQNDAANGRRVRRARFETHSSLPIGAACVVANAVRETLSSLLAAPVIMRLVEPAVPPPVAWKAIERDARLYCVRASIADAAIIVKRPDAIALAAALFGESSTCAEERALSPLECDVLDRLVGVIATNLSAVCGARDGHSVERVAAIDAFTTYFDLLVDEPVHGRIGIALSREPSAESGPKLDVAHLAGVRLKPRAFLALGTMEASAIARFDVGSIVSMSAATFERGVLSLAGRRLAAGACGVTNGRFALSVAAVREAM